MKCSGSGSNNAAAYQGLVALEGAEESVNLALQVL